MSRFIFSAACLLGVFLLLFPSQVRANKLYTIDLQAGDRLRGECVGVTDGVLTWRTVYGDSVRVPVGAVSELIYEEVWDLQLGDGQMLRGEWAVSKGILTLQSTLFGTLRCPITELRSGFPARSARGLTPERTAADALARKVADASNPPIASAPTPPENRAPPSSLQTMLRQSSILLRPKQWSVSTAFRYAHNRLLYSPDDMRQLSLTSQIQYGATPTFEASLQWPAIFSKKATLTSATNSPEPTTSNSSALRAGNPEVSGAWMVFGEGQVRPECVAMAGLTIPVNRANRGGVFRSRVALEFLKTSDPGALFAGVGWIHEGDGWQASPFQPIDRLIYHLGAAIGLNDELAMGFQAEGIYSPELRARNGSLLATQQEPVEGRFFINFRMTQNRYFEVAVEAPLSSDAHTTALDLTYIRRY